MAQTNDKRCLSIMLLFKVGVMMFLLLGAIAEKANAQTISIDESVNLTAITMNPFQSWVGPPNWCNNSRQLRFNYRIWGINLSNANNVSIEIDWGDGTAIQTVTGSTLNSTTTFSGSGTGASASTIIMTNVNANGIIKTYLPSPFCMYRVSITLVFNQGGTITRVTDNNIRKVTVWSRDNEGMGQLSLIEPNSGETIYPVCKNNPFEVNFLNNSRLACNMINSTPPNSGPEWEYTPRNQEPRFFQFRYYRVTGSPGGGIPGVTLDGSVPGTLWDDNAGPGGQPGWVEPIREWRDPGPITNADSYMDVLTQEMGSALADMANAEVGALYAIEVRMWNTCNPVVGTQLSNSNYVGTTSYIKVVDSPPNILSRTTSYCYEAATSQFNVNLQFTNDGETSIGTTPGSQFMPGIYRWYRFEDTSPTGPSSAALDRPILVVPTQSTTPNAAPTGTNAAQQINPTSGFPSALTNPVFNVHSSFPTFPVSTIANNNHRTFNTTPGHYRYWVTYEYIGKMTATAPIYICPNRPVLMTWTVREDIRSNIVADHITGSRTACSNDLITLTLPDDIYPDRYEFGGLMEYNWSTPTPEGHDGVRVSDVTVSPGTSTTAKGRSISFRVDPDRKQVSGANATVTLTVSRQWATDTNPATGTGTRCGSGETTITITVYPLPTATLAPVDVDVCDGANATLKVTNVAGGSGLSNQTFTITLNDGIQLVNQAFADKTTEVNINPRAITSSSSPVAAPAQTEYFIYTIKDNATQCISTNPYNGTTLPAGTGGATTPQILPYRPNGAGTAADPAVIRVTWRLNMSTVTFNPASITPADGSLLCSGSSQSFNISTAPADMPHTGRDVSQGGAAPTNPPGRDIPTQYKWHWAATTSPLTPHPTTGWIAGNSETYPQSGTIIMPTTVPAEGASYTLRAYREYTDLKCGQTTTRTWTYTIVPAPTATIPAQTIELCENYDATTEIKIHFTTTGYQTGNWSVHYSISGNGMTTVNSTTAVTATQTSTAGQGKGTITILLSDLAGSPNKYGNGYRVTLTSVVQNTTAACTGTITGNPATITLRRAPAVTITQPSPMRVICEDKDYVLDPLDLSFTGETGVNYNIVYRTLALDHPIATDPFFNVLGNNLPAGPFTGPNGGFTVVNDHNNYIDKDVGGHRTRIELTSVSQRYSYTPTYPQSWVSSNSYTCSTTPAASFTHDFAVDKFPDPAVILPDDREVCDYTIPIRAVATTSGTSSARWYIKDPAAPHNTSQYGFGAITNAPPTSGPLNPLEPFTATDESTTAHTTFGVNPHLGINAKYGRYTLVWEVSSTVANNVCPPSTAEIVVNLATNAGIASISTIPQIVCTDNFLMETQNTLGGWETPEWSVAASSPTTTAVTWAPIGTEGGANNQRVIVPQAGTYHFTFTRKVPPGCISTHATISMTFGDEPKVDWTNLKDANAIPHPFYCPGEEIRVNFTETTGITNNTTTYPRNVVTYEWYPQRTIGSYVFNQRSTDNPLLVPIGSTTNTGNVNETYNITRVTAINTVTVSGTGMENYAVLSRGCPSEERSFVIEVKPTPAFNFANINVCPGDVIPYSLTPALASATATNTVWTWSNTTAPSTPGLITPTVSGTQISLTPGQVNASNVNARGFLIHEPNDITLKVSVQGCESALNPFTITVNPTPTPTIAGTNTLCPIQNGKLVFNNLVDSLNNNLRYTWTVTGNNTSLTSSAQPPPMTNAQTRYNLPFSSNENITSGPTTSTITATAYGLVASDISGNVCSATSAAFTVTVNPRPDMRALTPHNQQMCGAEGGTALFNNIPFEVLNRGSATVTYTWVNELNERIAGLNHTNTTLSQSTLTYSGGATEAGISNIRIPENTGDTAMIARIMVTPTMSGCVGVARPVTLTVLPLPVVNPLTADFVCPDNPFRPIYPTVSNMTKFGGISNINFAITNSSPASVKLSGASGSQNSHTIYNNGQMVEFEAMANNQGVNLVTSIAVRATGNRIPSGSIVGCTGPATPYVLTVRPTPVITAPHTSVNNPPVIQELCPEQNFNAVTFTSNIHASHTPAIDPNVIFRWTILDNNINRSGLNSGAVDGLTNGNSGTMGGFTPIDNPTGRVITQTIQIIAELDGCYSEPVRYIQRLKPTPQMLDLTDVTYCPGDAVPARAIFHNVTSTGAYTGTAGVRWQVNNYNVVLPPVPGSFPAAGVYRDGNVASFTANDNNGTTALQSTVTVSAVVAGCTGNTDTYTIFVNPSPNLQRPPLLQGIANNTLFLCHDEVVESGMLDFTSPSFPTGANIEWWRTNVDIAETTPGTQLAVGSETLPNQGNIPRFTAKNSTAGSYTSSEVTSRITVRSKTTSAKGCPSQPDEFYITVGAKPKLGFTNISICASDEIKVPNFTTFVDPSVTIASPDTMYHWRVWDIKQTPPLPHSPGWFPHLGGLPGNLYPIPSKTDPARTGSIIKFKPDTTYYAGTPPSGGNPATLPNLLWGLQETEIIVRAYVALKKSSITGDGCPSNEEDMKITIKPLPITKFKPSTDNCVGDGTRKLYETVDGAPFSVYEWGVRSDPDDKPVLGGNWEYAPFIPNKNKYPYEVYEYPKSGEWSGYITVQETNQFGCTAPVKEMFIQTVPAPVVVLGPDMYVCSSSPVKLSASVNGIWDTDLLPPGLELDWFPTPDPGEAGKLDPRKTFYVVGANPDVFSMSLRAKHGSCYSNLETVKVTVYPLPYRPTLTTKSYCSDEPNWDMSVTSSSTDFRWYRMDGNDTLRIANSDHLSTVNMKDLVTHTNALPWYPIVRDTSFMYSVSQVIPYTYTSSGGTPTQLYCASDRTTAPMHLRISPKAPLPRNLTYCHEENLPRYTVGATKTSTNTVTFQWYNVPTGGSPLGGGFTFDVWRDRNDVSVEIPGAPPAYTSFDYYASSIALNGCESPRVKVPLVIFPKPQLDFRLEDNVDGQIIDGISKLGGCSPLMVNGFIEEKPNVKYQWLWFPGAVPEDVTTPSPQLHKYETSGSVPESYRMSLIGISTTNQDSMTLKYCRSEVERTVVVYPGVKADFVLTPDNEGCDPLTIYFNNRSSNAYNFRWYWDQAVSPPYPGNPLNDNPIQQPNQTDPNDPYYGRINANPVQTFINDDPAGARKDYRVWLQVDNNACYDNKETIISVFATPKASFSHNLPKGSVCPPAPVIFNNTASTGPANTDSTRYEWNIGDGNPRIQKGTGEFTHVFESLNASTQIPYMIIMTAFNEYTSQVTDKKYTCRSSYNQTITVNPQVIADFTSDVEGCSPMNARFQSQSLGAVSYFSWDWDDPDDPMYPVPGSGPSPTHIYVNPSHNTEKTYNVKLTVGNIHCSDSITKQFRLFPQPRASFDFGMDANGKLTNMGCQPLETVFINTSNNGVNSNNTRTLYIWDYNDGVTESTTNDGRHTHKFTNVLGNNLVLKPILKAVSTWEGSTDIWECTNNMSQLVTVYPYVKADIVLEDSVNCSPYYIRLRNASQGYDSGLFDFGDGQTLAISRTSGTQFTHLYINPSMSIDATYYLSLKVVAGTGCESEIMKKVTALAKPVADFRPGSPYPADYLFPAPPIILDNLIPLPDRDRLTYLWSYSEQGSNYMNNFSKNINPSPLDMLRDWGTYNITQRVTAPNDICSDSKTITINIVPPQAYANFEDVPPNCMPYAVTFENTSRYAKAYKWEFGDGYTSSLENPTHVYTDAGVYMVKLTVHGDNLFPSTIEKKVVVHPLPQADFKVAPTFLWVGQPLRAENYTSHEYSNRQPYNVWYRWDWGDNTPKDTIESPSHMYLKAGDYTITLTVGTYTDPQCIAVKTIPNAVELQNAGDIILPNVFKPRPEGEPSDVIPDRGYKNYLFYPPVASPVIKYRFMVFSRVGQLLYETTDQNRGWTGYFRGRLCDEGVYIYQIEGVFETGQSFNRVGDILLLR